MTATKIEWTEATWNPIVGCSLASPGCTNCYAMGFAGRIEAANAVTHSTARVAREYDGTTRRVNGKAVWTGKLALADDHKLTAPLRRKKPTTYFVNSMGDLFHEDAPDEWIDKVFAVMALAPQHTFQVLTKRSARMREYCSTIQRHGRWLQMEQIALDLGFDPRGRDDHGFDWISHKQLLPNVWLGVSTEDQRRANERIPDLLATPAAVRFISAEPLLGPIDLTNIRGNLCIYDALRGLRWHNQDEDRVGAILDYQKLNQVIIGGESGLAARPTHPDWIRAGRDQCADAGTPFFFKQWGTWAPVYDRDRDDPDWRMCDAIAARSPNGQWLNLAGGQGFHGARVMRMDRVGKARAGRLLDGIEHNGLPEIRP